ncbi:two-component regulator propeller domain-containing protein [Rugamonas sp. CCM 8940]|uniref:sensor histidine kinase n=1 Tax=Rugamonas sp. CCM 8940 TaxID=2765359 RepID=UPI0018F64F2E|nr:sensor histidine kinase [Rugamonas sp. CCM 8940]MBJ7311246.1 hypothetical protein [Rugamonas sp. CCM 8940]
MPFHTFPLPARRVGAAIALLLMVLPGRATNPPAPRTTPALQQQLSAPRPRLLDEYSHTSWGAQDGAPVDVLNFVQTRDGWLWLATATGLFRFDGKRFEMMDAIDGHSLPSTNVLAMYAPPEGGLWLGYRFGGVSHFHDGRAEHYGEAEGLPDGAVMHLSRAPDGVVWAATRDGMARLQGARFVPAGAELGLPAHIGRQVIFDRAGTQWISMQGGVYFRRRGEARFAPAWPRLDLMGMGLAPDGTLWASDAVDSYYRMRAEAPPAGTPVKAELPGSGMHFDRDGYMWLMRASSVQRRLPNLPLQPGQELTQDHGLSGGLPQCFFQDREGNVWIGTSAGVDRFRRNRLLSVPTETELDHAFLLPERGGRMLVGDRVGALRLFGTEGEVSVAAPVQVSAAYRAPDGAVWLGAERELWRRSGTQMRRIARPPAADGYDLQAISHADGADMWLSFSRAGLFLLRQGAWQKNGGLAGLPDSYAVSLLTQDDGVLWAGYPRNRVARVEAGRVVMYQAAQGLELGAVLTLYRRDGRLWAGGERGVAWFDAARARFVPLRGRNGEDFRGVSGIVRTGAGELWLFGADGLSHIGAAELAAELRRPGGGVAYERFDAHDGLVGAASQIRPVPSLVEADDGRLWLSTASKISWIDPAAIHRNRLSPPLQIQAVTADGRSYPPRDGLALPENTRGLRLDFTALGLSMPERIGFRYRLDGYDADWHDPGRLRQAFYTNLAPGDYRFRVMAANEDGMWNPQPAELRFRIRPSFLQTGWFAALCVAALAGLLSLLYVLRMQQVTRQLRQRMEERLDERERIARALHDTFLQSVQGLILRFQTLLKRLPADGEARALAERILDQADEVMVEGRNQLTGLRVEPSHGGDLPLAFAQYGQALEEQYPSRFSLALTGEPTPLAANACENVYHIGREALQNAFQHGAAKHIELELGYGREQFHLRVNDDGKGMDETVLSAGQRPGHWGLTGMRERARKIPGEVELWSRPGMGTEVTLRVAAARAYARPPTRTWLNRLNGWLARSDKLH